MRPSRSAFRLPFPAAINLAWLWAAIYILLLVGLRWTAVPDVRPEPFSWRGWEAIWSAAPAPLRICWTGLLLIGWLWANHRTQVILGRPAGAATTVALLAAASSTLVVAWAVLVMVRSTVPAWQLIQIYP